MFQMKTKLLLIALGGLFCVGASAGVIGSFDVNGGDGGNVAVGLTTIDWYPAGGPTGALVVVSGGTGIFFGLGSTTGTITDLDSTSQPVGVPFSLADFLVVLGLPSWDWTAEFIFPGIYDATECGLAAAVGQTCTPFPTSPFNLVNTAGGGSTAGFSLRGTATDGVDLYGFTANFTTQFGVPFQDYLPGILQGTPAVSTWSGTVTVNDDIPEPATLFLMSAGLIGLGLIRRVLR